MASTKFTYSPTGGTGSTTITCSVNETNIGQSDKTATITLLSAIRFNDIPKYRRKHLLYGAYGI